MRLYYYTSAENAIDDIKNEWIKISVLDAVNDPNEWVPNIETKNSSPISIEAIREKIMESFNIEWGFISFSKSWNIAPLWGMYADRFRGAVLEFEIADYLAREVEYVPRRVTCTQDITSNFDAEEFNRLIRRKSIDWAYEQEVRYVVQLFPRNCELVGTNYFAKIGLGKSSGHKIKLASVRCGPLITQQCYGRLMYLQHLNRNRCTIPIIRTRFGQASFALEDATR